jgi:hypothetical protein
MCAYPRAREALVTLDPVHDLQPGLEVHTADGAKLGTLKELDDDAFKVDAPLHPDYWLPRDKVLSFTNERVTMDFEHGELDGYKLHGR